MYHMSVIYLPGEGKGYPRRATGASMRAFNEGFMADRIDCDGLLQQPVEELPPAAGCSSVKPEGEFIKIMIQIPMRYAALMDPKQPCKRRSVIPQESPTPVPTPS